MAKPIPLTLDVEIKKPVLSRFVTKEEWSFSFKYYNQIENFGFDGKDERLSTKWFISFLDRLRDLSKTDKETFLEDHVIRQNWRYHEVDWNSYNIPIKRSDLKWLGKDIIENEELSFVQFHISKALGRVAGFWWENIFYIVLLDPLHNLQPSKYNNYEIRYSRPLACEFTSLLAQVENIKKIIHQASHEELKSLVLTVPETQHYTNGIIVFVDNEYASHLQSISNKVGFQKILEDGILANI